MGLDALSGNGITKRLLYLHSDATLTDPKDPLHNVRKSRIVLFTLVELVGFGATMAIVQTIGEFLVRCAFLPGLLIDGVQLRLDSRLSSCCWSHYAFFLCHDYRLRLQSWRFWMVRRLHHLYVLSPSHHSYNWPTNTPLLDNGLRRRNRHLILSHSSRLTSKTPPVVRPPRP